MLLRMVGGPAMILGTISLPQCLHVVSEFLLIQKGPNKSRRGSSCQRFPRVLPNHSQWKRHDVFN